MKLRVLLALCVVVACGNGDSKEAAKDNGPALGAHKESTPSAEEQQVLAAQAAKEAAVKRAAAARARLDQIEHELEELEKAVDAAVQQTVDAKNAAELATAKQNLQQLQASEAALKARAAQAQADAAAATRAQGVRISKECMDNPLAKGCM